MESNESERLPERTSPEAETPDEREAFWALVQRLLAANKAELDELRNGDR
jgi:hypothetical protein